MWMDARMRCEFECGERDERTSEVLFLRRLAPPLLLSLLQSPSPVAAQRSAEQKCGHWIAGGSGHGCDPINSGAYQSPNPECVNGYALSALHSTSAASKQEEGR